ncbi:MAG TPA: hypothetical protein VGW10_19320 [Solirubrobacteraceae bacterium]|nr:hypothetical protein [Solirubrobacteraceae bacterium]
MIDTAKNLVTGAVGVVGGAVRTLTGTKQNPRAEAAQKAAATRTRESAKRSATAKKAAQTRKAKAEQRSTTAKKAARTRRQRDARVEAMVEATKRD